MHARMYSYLIRTLVMVVLGVVIMPSQADAWLYDDRCASTSSSEFDLKSPNALMMLDRSGSMSSGAGNGMSRWDAAVTAIDEVTREFEKSGTCNNNDRSGCDKVRFGLGLFFSGRKTYRCRQRYRQYYTVRQRQSYRYRVRQAYTVRVRQSYRVRVRQSYQARVRQAYTVRVRQAYTVRVRQPYRVRVRQAYTVRVRQSYRVRVRQAYTVRVRQSYRVRVRVSYRVRVRQTYYVRVRQSYRVRVRQGYSVRVRVPYSYRTRQSYYVRVRVPRCSYYRTWYGYWYIRCNYYWTYQVRYRWVYQTRYRYQYQTRYRWVYQTQYRWVNQARQRWVYQTRYRWDYQTRYRYVNQTRYRWVYQTRYRWVNQTRYRWVYQTRYRWVNQTRYRWVNQTRYRWVYQTRYRWVYQTRYRWVNQTQYRWVWRTGYRWVNVQQWRWAYRWTTCSTYGNFAETDVGVGEDKRSQIMSVLNANSPSGGTPTGDAGEAIKNSSDLKDTDRANVGILITDGYPSGSAQARNAAQYLCDARTRSSAPVSSYVIGFSSGTDTDYNNLLAAAGGTGRCCNANDANCSESREVDVCTDFNQGQLNSAVNNIRRGGNGGLWCEGSHQANNPAQFKQALVSITSDIACTFELDLPSTYTSGKAYEDPGATKLRMYHSFYGWLDVAHKDSGQMDDELRSAGASGSTANQYRGEGWSFTDNNRTHVRLTPKLCNEISSGRGEEVTTAVACACPDIGGSCQVEGSTGVCGQGANVCDLSQGGVQVCEANYSPDETVGTECTVPGKQGRCATGQLVCSSGNETCEPMYRAMPEVCNGLDDDCDGYVDNLDDSADDFPNMSLPADYDALSCYGRNTCHCPTSANPDHSGTGATAQSELDDYVDTWGGECACGESFSE